MRRTPANPAAPVGDGECLRQFDPLRLGRLDRRGWVVEVGAAGRQALVAGPLLPEPRIAGVAAPAPDGGARIGGAKLAEFPPEFVGKRISLDGTLVDSRTGAEIDREAGGIRMGYGFDSVQFSSAVEYRVDKMEQRLGIASNWADDRATRCMCVHKSGP